MRLRVHRRLYTFAHPRPRPVGRCVAARTGKPFVDVSIRHEDALTTMPRVVVTWLVPWLTAIKFMNEMSSAEVVTVVRRCPSGAEIADETSATVTGTGSVRTTVPGPDGAPESGVPASRNTLHPTAHWRAVASDPVQFGKTMMRMSAVPPPPLSGVVGERPHAGASARSQARSSAAPPERIPQISTQRIADSFQLNPTRRRAL
jgi:hypothetical protein